MKPYNANIVVYAEDENEVAELQREFYAFVNRKREQGIAVRANKVTRALQMFRDNKYLNNFLKA